MPAALFVLGIQFQPRLLPEHKLPIGVAVCLSIRFYFSPCFGVLIDLNLTRFVGWGFLHYFDFCSIVISK